MTVIFSSNPNTSLISDPCSYCGGDHYGGFCSRIEEIEYYPDGTIKRLKLRKN